MMERNNYINLTLKYFEEAGQVVGLCPELGIASFGPTQEVSAERLSEAITKTLNAAERDGVIDEYLASRDIAVQSGRVIIHNSLAIGAEWTPSAHHGTSYAAASVLVG